MINWFLGFTKLGKVNDWLKGNRAVLTSVATILASAATIVAKTQEGGLSYLVHIMGTPEGAAIGIAIPILFNSLKGKRIEEKLDTVAVVQEETVKSEK